MQAVRVAGEWRQQEAQAETLGQAFIGWQVAGAFAGRKVGSFTKYARNLGVLPKPKTKPMSEAEVMAARERTEALAERVAEAFRKGGEHN